MKKILLPILLLPFFVAAQDSVKVTISIQARDLDYCGYYLDNNYALEELKDSVKIKFRIPGAPTGTTTVSITGYTMDWLTLMGTLKTDYVAILANHTSRIETLLRAVGQTYLSGKLDQIDANILGTDQSRRTFGRNRNRRQ